MKIAIIGYGFVGKAVEYGFKNPQNELTIIDPKLGNSLDVLSGDYDAIFVCVPTPMTDDGTIDSSIVETVLKKLDDRTGLVVLKSTVTPDIVQKYSTEMNNFVYNPEFLTERNYKNDFINPTHHVFGGEIEDCKKLEEVYKYSNCNPCSVKYCTAPEASAIKYGINSFLATKVAWMNEFYDFCGSNNIDYNEVSSGMQLDPRIGNTHMQVPGPDGKRWFGGACFKKDVSALLAITSEMKILETANLVNNTGRSLYELDEREKEQNIKYNTN